MSVTHLFGDVHSQHLVGHGQDTALGEELVHGQLEGGKWLEAGEATPRLMTSQLPLSVLRGGPDSNRGGGRKR